MLLLASPLFQSNHLTKMNPSFVLQTDGLAQLSSQTVLTLSKLKYKLGTAYNYTVTRNHSMQGDIVYEAPVQGYSYEGLDTIGLKLVVPPEAGPFQFGEIGIFFTNSVGADILVALVAFAKPQDKLQEATSGITSTWNFTAFLNFGQARAVFNILSGSCPCIVEHDGFALAGNPSPSVNATIIHDSTYDGEPVFLIRNNDKLWYPVGWCHAITLVSSKSTNAPCVVVDGAMDINWPTLRHDALWSLPAIPDTGHYLLQDNNGVMSLVDSVVGDTITCNTWPKDVVSEWFVVYYKCCDLEVTSRIIPN